MQEVYTGTGTPPTGAPRRRRGRVAGDARERAQLLRFERVNAFYGKSHILNDATLDVREGEIVALLGRNGAGKSTLLKTLAGLRAAGLRHASSSRGATSPACRRRTSRASASATCRRAAACSPA